MRRRIYVYQEDLNKEIVDLFHEIGSSFVVESVQNDVLTVIDNDYYNPEPFDFEALRELIIEDFAKDITIFIEPFKEKDFFIKENAECFIKLLSKGIHYFEDIITFVVVKNKVDLKKKIIEYIASCVNNEVIHTIREFVENNMNSSATSKKLFMHRNTLNYRIDNFIEITGINVRTFKGANAIYMLYNY